MRLLSRLLDPRPRTVARSSSLLRLHQLEGRDVPSATPTVDLSTQGSSGEINGAIFAQYDAQPTGTGVIDSFVRVQGPAKGGSEEGYNTDARPLAYDENKSPQFTRSLKVSDLPTVEIGGVLYKEFLLDINQKASSPLLSLDQLKIFLSNSGNLSGKLEDGKLNGLTAIYDLDAGANNWVELNANLNQGSGKGDMLLYVPAALFSGGEYVYLYSKFGENYAANGGFEEWAVGVGGSVVTPQTGTMSGSVFNARNGDPFVGWTVYLDANNNGVFDDGETFTTTNDSGQYVFTGVISGDYVVRVATSNIYEYDGVDHYDVSLPPGGNVEHLDFYLQLSNPT